MSQSALNKYSWISNSLFENAIRKEFGEFERFTIFLTSLEELQEVTDRETNFWCNIIRVLVNYTSLSVPKNVTFVLKISYVNPFAEESLEQYDPFMRELLFYQNVLPKIEELLLSVKDYTMLTKKYVEDNYSLGPMTLRDYFRAIRVINNQPQPKYLMFKELPSDKSAKANRRRGLDVEHLKVILKKLAKLHAASAVLNSRDEKLFSHHQQPNVSKHFSIFHSLFINCMHSLADEVSTETFDGAGALAKKLIELEQSVFDKASVAFIDDTDGFGVFCHGDLWLNNLLFEYDREAMPVDVTMIDFGLSYFGSPGIDLTYLLFTSSCDDIKEFEIDALLRFYHENLQHNLTKLAYRKPIPSLVQVHNYFMRSGIIGFLYSCLLLPMRFADAAAVKDLSAFVKHTEDDLKQRKALFADVDMKRRFEFLLSYFDRKGFLD